MRMLYLFLLMALLIPLISVVLDSRLGQAMAARLERSGPRGTGADAERISALEAEVERLTDEVRRLREQTEFVERLIADRAVRQLPPAGGTDASLPRPARPSEAGE